MSDFNSKVDLDTEIQKAEDILTIMTVIGVVSVAVIVIIGLII